MKPKNKKSAIQFLGVGDLVKTTDTSFMLFFSTDEEAPTVAVVDRFYQAVVEDRFATVLRTIVHLSVAYTEFLFVDTGERLWCEERHHRFPNPANNEFLIEKA